MDLITKSLAELEQFNAIKQDIAELATKCNNIVVTSETVAPAKDLAKQARDITKWIEDKRKEVTKPLLDKKKELDDFAKSLTLELDNSTKELRSQILNYEKEQERLRQLELARIEQERIEKLKELESIQSEVLKETLQAEIEIETKKEQKEITEVKNTGLRSVWKYELKNIKIVPKDYLCLDESKVKQAIKDGTREIKGLRIYEDKTLNLR